MVANGLRFLPPDWKKAGSLVIDEQKKGGGEAMQNESDDNAIRKVNVDFPSWMVAALDEEATRLQIPRQALIKLWLDEKLQKVKVRNETK